MIIFAFDVDRTLAIPDGTGDSLLYEPFMPMVNLARYVQGSSEMILLVTTARPEEIRHDTNSWLHQNGLFPEEVHMRESGDYREDWEVRVDQILKIKEKFGLDVFLYDDKVSNCLAVERETGTPCILVNAY